jgi:eukaryotic-like serine/threonine-protein kinase
MRGLMALTSGTRLGPYEIQEPLGAGGMGEVYRARDTRLDREVAIKVLPANLSSDPSLKQRLEREAKAVSKLSHPHICTLHDIGYQDGVDFLVMEYLEGETLEQRLLKGPLPSEQTLRYATQIADALAKAHKLGITHRDLKPSNVMLTKSGAKLMDFGLAKQSGVAPLAAALTEMTMEHSKLTGEGMLVGTFQYMAPEQLEGKEADARTDMFALGEVIYEMATGKPAFYGKSRASLIAAILTTEPPPITQLQPLTPLALERVVKKCLAKDPDDRWQSASDLASELKWMAEGGSQAGASSPIVSKRKHRERVAWTVAALALSAAALLAAIHFRESSKPTHVVRSLIAAEEGTFPILTGDFAGPPIVSPDGTAIAFVAAREQGAVFLWVRPLNALHARALPGTEGATFPFWSPDTRALGFFSGGKLKTVPVEGGTPSEVCVAPIGRGGTWGADGTIVFSPDFQSALARVSASGGTPKPATVMDASKHDSHRWPYFLPDGKHFLYLAVIHANVHDPNDGIYMASLDGRENHLVMKGYTNVAYADGRLLFMRDSALMAQPFDPRTGALQGEAERLAEDVLVDETVWRAQFDGSSSGVLAYASGGLTPWQAMWYDRSGKQVGAAGEKVFNLLSLRLSPDGSRLATEAGESNSEIWIYDRKRQVNTRLTFGPGTSSSPVWSPDGQWIAYVGVRGKNNLYRKPANGTGHEELLLEGDATGRNPFDWSADGKSLLFGVGDGSVRNQIWVLSLTGDRKPIPVTQNTVVAVSAKFSPDGHWVAYSSNESGRQEVYLMPFGGGAGKWQISNTGGVQPVWRRDGKELFFWSAENTLMSVPITLNPGKVEMGAAQQLFRFNNPVGIVGVVSPYDVTADGQRFVLITTPQQTPRPITLVTNWTAELKRQ